MKVGVTGSREARPDAVIRRLRMALVQWGATELHHGDCVGFDMQAHLVAKGLGIKTVSHPPKNDRLRAFCDSDEERPPLDYLARNRQIVLSVDAVIGAPDANERKRSGTWSTLRLAKKLKKPGLILGGFRFSDNPP